MSPKPTRPRVANSEKQQAEELKRSFYLRVMRAKIGDELRSQYDLSEPLPDRLAELLTELDDEQVDDFPTPPKRP